MRNFTLFFICLALLIFCPPMLVAGEKAPQAVNDLATTELAGYGSDPEIVKAVSAQNALGHTMDEVTAMDEKWKNTPGVEDYMKELITGACGPRLKEIMDSKPYYAEIFVMDKNGANVCMTDKTSDYWQGDEAKFKNSYNDGKGDVFVDDVEFDDSTQSYLVQVSVPVKDGDAVIGAITFGINIDELP